MTRYYKDYTIQVEKTNNADYGDGFRAEFFVSKNDGTKSNIRVLLIYNKTLTHGAVIEAVKRIIDTGI